MNGWKDACAIVGVGEIRPDGKRHVQFSRSGREIGGFPLPVVGWSGHAVRQGDGAILYYDAADFSLPCRVDVNGALYWRR